MKEFGQILGFILMAILHLLVIPATISLITLFMIPFWTAWIVWVSLMAIVIIVGNSCKE